MLRLLFWLFILLLAGVLALFAGSNRVVVVLALWPLPFVVEAPLYLPILLALLVGIVSGALAAWIGGGQRRREARRRSRRIAALERELAATQAAMPVAESLPAPLAARGA